MAKLTSLLILVSMLQVSAKTFAQKITLHEQNTPLETVFDHIRTQSGYDFFFSSSLMKNAKAVNIRVQNEALDVVLSRIFKDQPLAYSIKGKSIQISVKQADPQQNPGRVTGKVLDEKGEALPGATVRLVDTQVAVQTDVNGTYTLTVPPGIYTMEVRYVSYLTRRITGITVKEDQTSPLNIVLKVATSALKEVVITGNYQQASVEGLYARQKNAASITDGISAEQISKTPDNNLGQVLRRISGVTTIDTRYVVVRGLSERYNQAMLDGVIIPSTDMNRRNFSFDVVPQELVSNVVVNKTASPEYSAEFSGGQIMINTLDIPAENFNSLTIGTGYNTRTTGKDFVHLGKISTGDYLGMDNQKRQLPENVQSWIRNNQNLEMPDFAIPQSKQFNAGQLKAYTYTARPNQNYRFSIGRTYSLKNELKTGFAGGLTYRNTQETNPFHSIRRTGYSFLGGAEPIDTAAIRSSGNSHTFNTTLGAVLNAGIQGKKFKVGVKNYYSRVFNENTQDASRKLQDDDRRYLEFLSVPALTTVYQSKLEGENLVGNNGLKFNWSGSYTRIGQQIMDMRRMRYFRSASLLGVDYYDKPDVRAAGDAAADYDFRLGTRLKEDDFNWSGSLSQPFNFLKDKSLLKAGYAGWHKARSLGSTQVSIIRENGQIGAPEISGRYEDVMAPDRVGATGDSAFYYADKRLNGTQYNGSSRFHSFYLMLDQRFFQKLRLVYGIRAENFNLANSQEQWLRDQAGGFFGNKVDPYITGEKNWRFLPSVNITYSLTSKMNFRAAYSTTMVRPDFRETSYFELYDAFMESYISGWNVVSTQIKNFDLRYEWYPSAGEIISVSAFYKDFDKPLELVDQPVTGGTGRYRYLRFQNQKRAINKGVELEFRKSLGFIADRQWLRNLTIYGNGTWMKSEVDAVSYRVVTKDNGNSYILLEDSVYGAKRTLYGQSPWIINAGINYNSTYFGANIGYNRSAYRPYVTALDPNMVEYENGRNVLDLQLSARILKKKAEIKLNISNLLDEYTLFYLNATGFDGNGDAQHPFKKVNGTEAYEKDKGDRITYRMKNGRTFNLSLTYKF